MLKFIALAFLSLSKANELAHIENDILDEKFENESQQTNSLFEVNMSAYEQSRNALNFTGKVVLVTGSSSGIGAEIVRLFSYLGAQVIVTGRNVTRIKQVAYECSKLSPYGLQPLKVAADLTIYDQLYNLFVQTINAFNRLDILVNNTGINLSGRLIDRNFSRIYQAVTAIDETAVLQLTQLFIPYLNQTNGTIINIASNTIAYPLLAMGVYGMAKSAINLLSQELAIELGPRIRVNSIRPGLTLTPATQPEILELQAYTPLAVSVVRDTSMRRLGQPLDMANAAIFLASPLAQFITGQYMTVDGGYYPQIR